MPQISQKLLDDFTSLIPRLAVHIAESSNVQDQMDKLYKILITGNGAPPLPETVRIHSAWIIAHDAIALQVEATRNDLAKETRLFRRQIQGLVISQVIAFIFLAIAVMLGLR